MRRRSERVARINDSRGGGNFHIIWSIMWIKQKKGERYGFRLMLLEYLSHVSSEYEDRQAWVNEIFSAADLVYKVRNKLEIALQ